MTNDETHETPQFAISLFSSSDARSLPNVAPECVINGLKKTPADLFSSSESRLQQNIRAGDREMALRLAFWAEYHLACREGRRMLTHKIWGGIMHKDHFYKKFLTSPGWVAYICTEPPSLRALNEALVRKAFLHCHKLLEADLRDEVIVEKLDKEGEVISRTITYKHNAVAERTRNELRKSLQADKPPRKNGADRRDEDEEEPEADKQEEKVELRKPTISPMEEMAMLNKSLKAKGGENARTDK